MRLRAWLTFVLIGSSLACAGKLDIPRDPRVGPVRLVHGGAPPDVTALVAAVYAPDFAPADARRRAQEVLARYPESGVAHEVAGYLAILADNAGDAWYHFWKAAQDLDAPLTELYLWELDVDPTRGQLDANLALCQALRLQHPAPTVRDAATVWTARTLQRLGRPAEAHAVIAGTGAIETWALLGAFDNEAGKGFLTSFPPEKHIDFATTIPGPLVPLSWHPAPIGPLGAIEVGHAVAPMDPGVAYLATWIHAAAAGPADLRVTTPQATRAWLNGGLVLSEERVNRADIDNLIVPVQLRVGWNQLLIKSAQKDGIWWLRARLTDAVGTPLPGLTYAAQPQPFVAAPDHPPALRAVPPALDQVVPENRRALLTSRWLTRGGHPVPAQGALQDFVRRAPGNPLGAYFMSLSYWANGEAGKSLDLINRSVERMGADAPAFLRLRARYYLQRGLQDKAQADFLKELSSTNQARAAEHELAELFGRRGWPIDHCRLLEATVQKWPDSASTWLALGRCRVALDYTAAAEAAFTRALALEPGNPDALGQLYRRAAIEGRFADAERWTLRLRERSPTAPRYPSQLGELARRQGNFREAESLFRAAIDLNPLWAWPHKQLGDLFWEQARQSDALGEWKLAHQRDPNDSVLAQRIEFHEPTRLGFIDAYVPGDDVIDQALARPIKPHPGARIAMALDDEVTEVNADGSAKRVVTTVSRALTEAGREALIAYHLPRAGTVKLLQSYALSATGERQEASSIRGSEIRFRNLEIGSRVVVQFVHYAPANHFLQNHFVADWAFNSAGGQHERSRWVLVLPKDRALSIQVQGPIRQEESVVGSRRVRIWSAEGAPPLVPEANSLPVIDLIWRVSVSTVPDWDEYVRWERALLVDAFQDGPQLDALAARLTAGAAGPRDKLDRLFHHVTQEIRYQQDYENTVAGVRPHAGVVVLERGYGDCKDKAVLLIQLAKRAGLEMDFALLRTRPAGQALRDVPNQQFNHAIVYVPAQPGIAEPFFLDPTSDGLDLGNLPVVDQGASSLVLEPASGSWRWISIPYDPAALSYGRVSLRVAIASPSEARGEATFTLRGQSGLALRHVLRNKSQAEQALQNIASKIFPGVKLLGSPAFPEEDTRKPVALSFELDAARTIQPEDDHYRFTLMQVEEQLAGVVALEHRETPLLLGAPGESEQKMEVTLPEGYLPLHVPPEFSITHPCFTLTRKTTIKGRAITLSVMNRMLCHEVSVADYPVFRDRVRDGVDKLRDVISFRAAPAQAAPSGSPAHRH